MKPLVFQISRHKSEDDLSIPELNEEIHQGERFYIKRFRVNQARLQAKP